MLNERTVFVLFKFDPNLNRQVNHFLKKKQQRKKYQPDLKQCSYLFLSNIEK
jgi:hypothetical protein